MATPKLEFSQGSARAATPWGRDRQPASERTDETVADEMERWIDKDACDGFNIMFPFLPEGLDDFVDRMIPELQRRGRFRAGYEGATLQENLRLPRPENRVFPNLASAAAE